MRLSGPVTFGLVPPAELPSKATAAPDFAGPATHTAKCGAPPARFYGASSRGAPNFASAAPTGCKVWRAAGPGRRLLTQKDRTR
jgi:hypothetical protein